MLDHYYVRPKTADRIRALWLGPAIDQYAAWASARGAAKATVSGHLQALIHFDQFARENPSGRMGCKDVSGRCACFSDTSIAKACCPRI